MSMPNYLKTSRRIVKLFVTDYWKNMALLSRRDLILVSISLIVTSESVMQMIFRHCNEHLRVLQRRYDEVFRIFGSWRFNQTL